jgi:hypothetical protein
VGDYFLIPLKLIITFLGRIFVTLVKAQKIQRNNMNMFYIQRRDNICGAKIKSLV